VRYYRDNDRVLHRRENANRLRRLTFQSVAEAEGYLWRIARSIGVPKDATMAPHKVLFSGRPHAVDADPRDVRTATLTVAAHGYPFVDYANMARMAIDVDGALEYYSACWGDVVADTWTPRISADDAYRLMRPVYDSLQDTPGRHSSRQQHSPAGVCSAKRVSHGQTRWRLAPGAAPRAAGVGVHDRTPTVWRDLDRRGGRQGPGWVPPVGAQRGTPDDAVSWAALTG
jgi:hypothetical protein